MTPVTEIEPKTFANARNASLRDEDRNVLIDLDDDAFRRARRSIARMIAERAIQIMREQKNGKGDKQKV